MADGFVIVQPDSTGKSVDTSEIAVGANTVERQRINISDPVAAAGLAPVTNSQTVGTEYGLVVREATALYSRNNAQMLDTLNEILAQLVLLNLNIASSMPSAHVDNDAVLLDITPTLN